MKTMTTVEVQRAIESGAALKLIDVREVEEVEAGHIPGIINIPLSTLELHMPELDKSEKYIIVCRSGNRSGMATQLLESHGYDVTNMVGGMLEWQGEVE
ncbi:MAG: rhodanese-like domain-containing protein [Lysinibacillus sp.]